ncbi:hypothetical protein V8C42DRAFT_320894, partial [Trichoderma barbatum]
MRSALVAFLWVSVIRLLKKGVALLFSPKQIRSTSKTGRRPGRWYPPRDSLFEQQDGIGDRRAADDSQIRRRYAFGDLQVMMVARM